MKPGTKVKRIKDCVFGILESNKIYTIGDIDKYWKKNYNRPRPFSDTVLIKGYGMFNKKHFELVK